MFQPLFTNRHYAAREGDKEKEGRGEQEREGENKKNKKGPWINTEKIKKREKRDRRRKDWL